MEGAGLVIREDAMGNIFGRLEGSDPHAGGPSAVTATTSPAVSLPIPKHFAHIQFTGDGK